MVESLSLLGSRTVSEECSMPPFHLANMSCGGCAKGVIAALRQVDPEARAEAALDRRTVSMEAAAAAGELDMALRRAGWRSALPSA
jgi:copper chaperone